MTYLVEVYELREYKCLYTVTADSKEEALELAEIGNTDDEKDLQLVGVTNREAIPETIEEEGDEQ